MQLNVLYFAHVRERVCHASEVLDVPEAATVAQVCAVLEARYPALAGLMDAVRVAVNGEFAAAEDVVPAGAEFVLIPPVAGGAGLAPVALTEDALDAVRTQALADYVGDARHGAVVTFVGAVRNHARGRAVERLHYEAYGPMALRQLRAIVAEVEAAFPGTRVAVHHRVGTLEIGENAVVVAAGSAHRAEAFDAARRVIDRLKEDVPIWKREMGPDGAEWVSDRP